MNLKNYKSFYFQITETEHYDEMCDNNSPNEIPSPNNSNNMETDEIVTTEEHLNNYMNDQDIVDDDDDGDDCDRDDFHCGKNEIDVNDVNILQPQNSDENQYSNEEYLEIETNEQMTDETLTTTEICYMENDGILKFITDNEKNENGTINEDGMKKIPNLWSDYFWNCNECECQYQNVFDLRKHYAVAHHKRIKYVCIDCPKTFNKYMAFQKHICLRHRPHLKYWFVYIFKFILFMYGTGWVHILNVYFFYIYYYISVVMFVQHAFGIFHYSKIIVTSILILIVHFYVKHVVKDFVVIVHYKYILYHIYHNI